MSAPVSARVRWGILGCGAIAASAIAPAIRWSKHGELVAVASRTKARAEERAKVVEARVAHASYEALVADPNIDAIYIGTPNGDHARWALAAVENGKHVLCDKSLCLRDDEAEKLRAAFTARKRRLVEGFMVRHHPQWSRARELVTEIGGATHVRAWFRAMLDRKDDHRWSAELGGGALFDVGCYAINAARYFVGEEPRRARAFVKLRDAGVDESTDALLEFPGGAIASVHGSLRAPFEQGVVVSGPRGRVIVERPFVPHWEPAEVVIERDGKREVERIGGANHFLHMVEHVEQCFLDPWKDLYPAEDGVANVAACNLVRRASIEA
jgi:predicted dehydrogenase